MPSPANQLSAEANALVSMGKIQTASGRWVEPFNLDPELVTIEDIAHALSNQCRFAGHTQMFYSVAQHSVAVSQLAEVVFVDGLRSKVWTFLPENKRASKLVGLEGLMHDSPEAYLIDLPRPIKHQPVMQPYRDAEDRAYRVIAAKFGLPSVISDIVHKADNKQLEIEARSLLIPPPSWASPDVPRIDRIWLPEEARLRFLQRFYELQSSSEKE